MKGIRNIPVTKRRGMSKNFDLQEWLINSKIHESIPIERSGFHRNRIGDGVGRSLTDISYSMLQC